MSQRRISLALLALHGMMLLFALSAVLSLRFAYNPNLSMGTVLALLASVALYFVVVYAARPRPISRLIAGAGTIIATGLALYFITQFKYYSYPETNSTLQHIGELTSVLPNLNLGYLHPNGLATFLEMALPISVGLVVSTYHRWLQAIWLVCTLLMVFAILLTASRGAWIGLSIAGIIWMVVLTMRRISRKWGIAVATSIGIVLVMVVIAAVLTAPRIRPLSSAVATFSTRLELYRNSLYLVRDYAVTGIGLGDTFALVYSRYGLLIFVPFLTYTHNLPLAVWFGQGLLGIAAFVGIIILFYALIFRVIHQTRAGALFYGAWLGVTATLIHGLDDARQYTESPWVMPALFFGIALALACGTRALRRWEEDVLEKDQELPQRSWRRMLTVLAVVLALIAGGAFIWRRPIVATWYTNLGALDETRADKFIDPNMPEAQRTILEHSAQAWYAKALAIDPNLPNANRRMGNLLVNQGQYTTAVPLLEKAAAGEAYNPAAIKGLGLAYVWVGRTSEAADTLKRLKDWAAAAQELQTWYQYRSEQNQLLLAAYALETYALMLGEENTSLNVWLIIADTFRETGVPDRARTWYELVLKYDATNQQAKDGLAALGD